MQLYSEIGMAVRFRKQLDKGMMRHLTDPPGMAEFASRTVQTEQVENDCRTRLVNILHFLKLYGWTVIASTAPVIIEVFWKSLKSWITHIVNTYKRR
jgi:hypothetical protein